MRKANLTKIDDINIAPSDSLKRETLAVMESFENTRESPCASNRMKPLKRIVLIAAIAVLFLVLIGAGVRVFDYLAYVPGIGIITAHQDRIYTLKEKTGLGTFYVEAMSAVPVTEGEYKGMWKIHILTDKHITGSMLNDPKHTAPIYLTGKNGEKFPIERSGGNSTVSRYEGYAVINGSGDYTLTWDGYDYTVTLQTLENTVWSNYSYPVDEGITLIAFPLAENSRYLVYDIIFDTENEDIIYWTEHCEILGIEFINNIRIDDTEGNHYSGTSFVGSLAQKDENGEENGINALLDYKLEHAVKLNKELAAPVSKIETHAIGLMFTFLKDMPEYSITIPTEEEISNGAELPGGTVNIEDHGISMQVDIECTQIEGEDGMFELVLTQRDTTSSLEYNVSNVIALMRCDTTGERDMAGNGAKIRRFKVTYGDVVDISIGDLTVYIDGDWVIDFFGDK